MKKYILILISGLLVGITTNIGHPITPYYINQIELPKIVFGYFFAAMSLGMLIFGRSFCFSLRSTLGFIMSQVAQLSTYGRNSSRRAEHFSKFFSWQECTP